VRTYVRRADSTDGSRPVVLNVAYVQYSAAAWLTVRALRERPSTGEQCGRLLVSTRASTCLLASNSTEPVSRRVLDQLSLSPIDTALSSYSTDLSSRRRLSALCPSFWGSFSARRSRREARAATSRRPTVPDLEQDRPLQRRATAAPPTSVRIQACRRYGYLYR